MRPAPPARCAVTAPCVMLEHDSVEIQRSGEPFFMERRRADAGRMTLSLCCPVLGSARAGDDRRHAGTPVQSPAVQKRAVERGSGVYRLSATLDRVSRDHRECEEESK